MRLERCEAKALGIVVLSLTGMISNTVFAQNTVSPTFDVAVIKPARPDETGMHWDSDTNTTRIGNFPLFELILRAYNLKTPSQVLEAPGWTEQDRYDVVAKMSPEEYRRLESLPQLQSDEEYRGMLQAMLAERFGLRIEHTTRRMPRFAMEQVVQGSLGPALQSTPAGADGRPVGDKNVLQHGNQNKVSMEVSGATMDDIADLFSGRDEIGQRVIINRTGVTGYYRFNLEYAPDRGMGISPEATLPGLLDVMRLQLGLKLVKDEGDVPVVIVKAAKKPEFD